MIRTIGLAAAFALASTSAMAEKITFSGTGLVASARSTLPQTGSAAVGSTFEFSFGFDTDDASFYEGDEYYAYYDLPLNDFTATIGSYAFELARDPYYVPGVLISRGFSFVDGPYSEKVIDFQFYLTGAIKPLGSTASPFEIAPGKYDNLVVSALFKTNETDTALGIDQLLDPKTAAQRTFDYDVNTARGIYGQLSGSYTGGFATAAAVPEPGTWSLVLLGFAMLGAALRRNFRPSANLPVMLNSFQHPCA